MRSFEEDPGGAIASGALTAGALEADEVAVGAIGAKTVGEILAEVKTGARSSSS
jgi:hypothetical protein